MPDGASFTVIRSGTPDNSAGAQLGTVGTQQDSAVKMVSSVLGVEVLPNAPTPHRSSGGADTGADMSSAGFGATGTELTKNCGSIVVWVEFDTAGASCTLTPVFYDDSATPAPMALGPQITFSASAKRVSAAGNYMSTAQVVESFGFRRFKFYKDTVSAGNIVVHAIPVRP